MAEYWAILNRLRHDLGKRFTVAEEHTADPRQINVLFLRQRRDEMLIVAMDTRWLAGLDQDDASAAPTEYKRLVMMVRQFFTHPAYLPSRSFTWPGSTESREELRHALNPPRRTYRT